jgi:predicted house-cleaning noncanonical NTP pyrophosphatase (MazG superfamily)
VGQVTEKLVRDRIPELIRTAGDDPIVRVAGAEERFALLVAKLREETDEVAAAHPLEVPEELGDLLEVLHAVADLHGISWHRVERAASVKRNLRGGFTEYLVWAGNR